MEVRILPPVFSALAFNWVTGCFKKGVGCTYRVFEKFRKLKVVWIWEKIFERKVYREICRGEYFSLNRNFNLEISLGCKESISAIL